MKKFHVQKVILQDDGRISLTCDCCRRPNAYGLEEAQTYLTMFAKEVTQGDNYFFDCEYENCESGTKLSDGDDRIRQIIGMSNGNKNSDPV